MVSGELLRSLHSNIDRHAWSDRQSEEELSAQMIGAFEEAHEGLKLFKVQEDGTTPGDQSGAAGVAIVIASGYVMTGYCGDCRAIMGRTGADGELETVELSHDHKLTHPMEEDRIIATGAYIRPEQQEPYFEPARVYADKDNPRKGPGLTLARSLGDFDADPYGIVPTPDVGFHRIVHGTDRFIVMASDGLWEFLTNEEICQVSSSEPYAVSQPMCSEPSRRAC